MLRSQDRPVHKDSRVLEGLRTYRPRSRVRHCLYIDWGGGCARRDLLSFRIKQKLSSLVASCVQLIGPVAGRVAHVKRDSGQRTYAAVPSITLTRGRRGSTPSPTTGGEREMRGAVGLRIERRDYDRAS